ncbi:hypothetical protein [Desulfosporosinus meridiei]|uniref:Uncharacterized protein n=1 Tax=Desulfosporosinus meridiei (strain ATCC BAA-275 / DSM 13257 / KCTC 12902 / NCIMB 13706 / S10) TaxID=768704 RepID=J7IXQ1_DESMD|nr:hypothetical protein [Desulfosporosinus meridiei]AFQ44919.1 hypothetical protein Desmer_3036 [Desulfosporosinus meridiei DSM 13257]
MKKLALIFLIIAVMMFGSSPVLASPESSKSNSIESGIGIEALQLIQGGYSSIQNAGNNHNEKFHGIIMSLTKKHVSTPTKCSHAFFVKYLRSPTLRL